MLKLCRVDIERSQEIYATIDRYVAHVVDKLHPRQVILFGSFATGDIHEGSDVDICVVAEFKEEFLDRMKILMDLNDLGLPLEPVGYTPSEFENMKEGGNSFIREVVEKGKVLYEAQCHGNVGA